MQSIASNYMLVRWNQNNFLQKGFSYVYTVAHPQHSPHCSLNVRLCVHMCAHVHVCVHVCTHVGVNLQAGTVQYCV